MRIDFRAAPSQVLKYFCARQPLLEATIRDTLRENERRTRAKKAAEIDERRKKMRRTGEDRENERRKRKKERGEREEGAVRNGEKDVAMRVSSCEWRRYPAKPGDA